MGSSRSRRGVPQGGGGVRRRRLPLSAARRGEHRLSVRSGADRGAEGARRACRQSAGDLCRHAQPGDSEARPADMVITMHLCRGNFRSTWSPPAATSRSPRCCSTRSTPMRYFMEYDSDRAGGFEPLRFVPRGHKVVVLGLVTSKTGDAGEQGRAEASDRRGGEVSAARSACAVAAMRLRQHRGRQRADRGRAVGEAAPVRRGCEEVWG